MSLCDSCKYQYNVEQLKPCIIYKDDCEFYEPDDFHKEPKTGQSEIDFIQPKKTVGKLISADVLDKIRAEIDAHREELKTMADDDWYAGKIRGHDCDIEIIDKYRESEQEPKTGHWIRGLSTYFNVEVYCCSECKKWFAYKSEKCPNCHVRMVTESEDKE